MSGGKADPRAQLIYLEVRFFGKHKPQDPILSFKIPKKSKRLRILTKEILTAAQGVRVHLGAGAPPQLSRVRTEAATIKEHSRRVRPLSALKRNRPLARGFGGGALAGRRECSYSSYFVLRPTP